MYLLACIYLALFVNFFILLTSSLCNLFCNVNLTAPPATLPIFSLNFQSYALPSFPQNLTTLLGGVSAPGRAANVWWQPLHGQRLPAEEWQCFPFPRILCPLAVPLSVRFLARGALCPVCHMLEPSLLPAWDHEITANNNNVNILNLQNKRHRD